MAEITLEPHPLSKVIPISLKINDTDANVVTRLATKKQFNTSDTDAWLSFALEGLESTNGEYDLTMVNVDEKPIGSIVHKTSLPFSAIPFYYKMDSGADLLTNEIRHAGRWIGQIVVRLANGDTTSRQFDFAISGHLLDGNEARLILIEDYNSLIATINTSKDLLTQYNVDYAALLVDLAAAETTRTATYNQLLADQQANIEAFDVALDDGIVAANLATKLQDFETTNNSRLLSAEQQLAESDVLYSKQNTTRNPTPSLVAHKSIKPLVTFIDDDGALTVLTKLKPLSETHGIPFVIALIGSFIEAGTGITPTQAIDLQNNLGWEIASHEYNHIPLNDIGYDEEDYQYELKYSAEYLRSKGLDVKNIVYPYGRYNDRIKEITAQVYNCGVGTDTGVNTSPLQTYQLKRIAFPGTAPNNTFEWYKSQIDNANASNAWLIWMLHCSQPVHDATQQALLNDIIVYIKSINVDIVTIQEGLNRNGNVLATNDNKYYLAADGKNNIINYTNLPINSQTGTEQINADMPPNQFDFGKTYVSQIYTANERAKFPINQGGTFTCVMTDSYLNSYQLYVTDKRTYKRIGTASGASWGVWRRLLEATQGLFNIAETTIPANSSVVKGIASGVYDFVYMPILTPKVLLPDGVIFDIHHNGPYGSWVITLTNTTAAGKVVPEGDWAYMLIDL